MRVAVGGDDAGRVVEAVAMVRRSSWVDTGVDGEKAGMAVSTALNRGILLGTLVVLKVVLMGGEARGLGRLPIRRGKRR